MTKALLFRSLSALLLLGAPALAAAPVAPADDELGRQITAMAKPAVDSGLITGLTIAVIRGNETRVVGLGSTRKGGGKLPDGKTLYEIGSVSKVFTSLLLADLAARGTVTLDDPIQKYLPSTVSVPRYHGQSITLLHLATHTSSLPRMPTNFTPKNPANPYADYTVEQLYAFIVAHPISRAPGDRYEYSNLGAGLLGNIVGRAAQSDYEKLLAERVTGPLAMTSTKVTLAAAEKAQLAEGHDGDGEVVAYWDLPAMAGAGGIHSTADDLVKFLRAQIDPPASLKSAIELSQAPRHEAGTTDAMALGWHVRSDHKAIWHNGQTAGFHTYVAFDPSRRAGVVVLASSAVGAVDDIGFALLRVAAGDSRVTPPRIRREVKLDAAVLDRYVGDYALAPMMVVSLHRDGDRLIAEATGQPPFRLHAESDTHFFLRAVPAEIDFSTSATGEVELVLHQGGRDVKAKRQPHVAAP